MNITHALQKITSQFWVIEWGRPDIISWLYRNNIDPKSTVQKHILFDFIDDYAAFKIKKEELEMFIKSFSKDRWRFIVSLNTWIKL